MRSVEVREAFFEYFKSKQHNIVSSAPMVVKNDPTLMFTNAGMNQFKELFLGNKPIEFNRIADSQKCLRVSGKHNDLEEVGHDTYHHTMFEMLGNWSFGDYFKKEAIDMAWEFLVKVMKIDENRLYATVFEGAKDENLGKDEEAFEHWTNYLPKSRILNGSKKDNFWEMGNTGPCGPCSEIHVDIRSDEEREKISGDQLVNKDHPLVIEIWNLVFIQYNRKADSSLEALPNQHVDTGMGFERLCMVLQDKKSNYDTDVFQPIIQEIGRISNVIYGKDEEADIAMRVIADHLRAISFSIADGQLPSNNKAGYVIRRILRRAVRYGYTFLGQNNPFMYKLVSVLAENMGNAYPELVDQKDLIKKVIKEEEASFLRTLETGIRLLDQIISKTKKENKTIIDGKTAFELYDTYGFPLDLTELILKEKEFSLDKEEFDAELNKQKERSRSATSIDTDDWVELLKDDVEEFIGYDYLEADVKITRYRKIKSKGKESYQLVFNLTPFYAESGGQVGDKGYIEANGEKVEIIDTLKENNLTIHISKKLPADPRANFRAVVNKKKRSLTENNHSATHLLHHALREVLGDHVEQKGSLVNADYLRFDFSHFQKLSNEDLVKIEQIVNGKIRENIPVDENRTIPMPEAIKKGAIALFGEKYGDLVRTIQFGESIELCGGCHVKATGNIGFFRIASESAIAAGIRRIEAITADKVEEYVQERLETLEDIRAIVKTTGDLKKGIENLVNENIALKKQLEGFQKQHAKALKNNIKAELQEHNGIKLLITKLNVDSANAIKDIAFQLRGELDNLFFVAGAEIDGKANLAIMISDKLVEEMKLDAGKIIREIAKEIQGGGGGQPFFATAGGKNPAGIDKALEKAKEFITSK
jgi:alanyl-tRNA synthetase